MSRFVRVLLALAVLGALAFGSVAATVAGGPKVLDARMVGVPAGGPVLHGLTGGSAPWIADDARAKLFADGRLEVDVQGLTLLNGTNPIRTGFAAITCNSAEVTRSAIVPFSTAGDALVVTRVDLPDLCLAPAVFFVGITATGAERWFAVTGF